MNESDFWRGKRVFVTGHTGFKGSWLALWLQRMGAELTGYALAPPTEPSLFTLANVSLGMESIQGDVRDLAALSEAIQAAQPEIVLHLAAQAIVRRSYQDPVETYSTNVMGTVHLLDAVRRCESVRAVVVVTSDKCYENREWVWGYRENDPMGGHDPYSSSKGCAELVVDAFRRSYFEGGRPLTLASVRAGNVIGGGDWAEDRLVPDIMRAILAGEPVAIRNPMATRPWQHVLEPLRGYLTLARLLFEEGDAFSGGWNFGPTEDDVRPVSWVVDVLTTRWGGGARWELDGGAQPHEAFSLTLNCSKAHWKLGWRPRLGLDPALDWIVEWYRGYSRGESARELVMRDVERYEGLAAAPPRSIER